MKATAVGALRSKTIWFAVALAVLSTLASGMEDLKPYLGTWGPLVGQAVAVAIAVLRVLTSLPLADKAPQGPTVVAEEPPHDDGTAADDSQ